MTAEEKFIPEGRTVVGEKSFRFHCHSGVECFKTCCRKLELYLYPYDILRLKSCLGIDSAVFMHTYTRIAEGSHPFFPAVMLNMRDNVGGSCPFLGEEGCAAYKDRPSACRTYPLERAVEQQGRQQGLVAHYFMTHHPYCKGHFENKEYTVRHWERDQFIHDYNLMNDCWAEIDAFFSTNPWQGEGKAGPRQQLAFMVCYNVDEFRAYANRHHLLKSFRLDRERRRRIERDDAELLRFGFDWLQFVLGDRPTLQLR